MRIGMMATPHTTAPHDYQRSLNPAGSPTAKSRELGEVLGRRRTLGQVTTARLLRTVQATRLQFGVYAAEPCRQMYPYRMALPDYRADVSNLMLAKW